MKEKKSKYKKWYKSRGTAEEEGARAEYCEAKRVAKSVVAKAKQEERKKFGERLDTTEGRKQVFKIAKQMAKERRDVIGVNCLKKENGKVIVKPNEVKERWRLYMEKLLNTENSWDETLEEERVEGPPEKITTEEVKEAIDHLKNGKASGPTGVVGEMLKAGGRKVVNGLTELCNEIIREKKIPKDWQLSTLIPIYKGKGDPMQCGSYRAVKLLEHGMKVFERVLEKRLRSKVNINEAQFGFMPGRGTTDAIFIVRQLQEKFLAKKKDLFYAFIDLEKAFDRVPREVVRWALRKFGVEEWMVVTVMIMYDEVRTVVRTKYGNSRELEVKVGVHQGSVLSPLLFVTVMDALTERVRQGLPWDLLYADDIVLVAETMELLKQKVIEWKDCMEAKGLKVNVGKTKVMKCGIDCGDVERTGRWPCGVCGKGVARNSIQCKDCELWVHKRCSRLRGSLASAVGNFVCGSCATKHTRPGAGEDMCLDGDVHLESVVKFCYLGDMLSADGGAELASVTRVRCAWGKFKELGGMLLKKDVPLKLKGRVYAACVRSVMIYGSETWSIKLEQTRRFERAEMRMVRWMCGVSLREKKRSDDLRSMLGIENVKHVMARSRLRWMGHVLRKDDDDWVKGCMEFEVEGTRCRGRPKLTWRKVVEADMRKRGMKREDAQDRDKWRQMSWEIPGQPPQTRGKPP